MNSRTTGENRDLLLRMIDESYRLPNWNETNLQSALKRVSPETAGCRPAHVKRSIADITVHCAYWKYALNRRLTGGKRGGFPYKGSNWFPTPESLSKQQWQEYRVLLEQQHDQLVETLKQLPKPLSDRKTKADGAWSKLQRTYWLAIHDGYHTGQINMLKAMFRRAKCK